MEEQDRGSQANSSPAGSSPGALSEPEYTLRLTAAAARGMGLAFHASQAPDRMAILSRYGERSFRELNARANQLARLLRSVGLETGQAVALLCRNRPEFVESLSAVQRTGLRITPINWHLTPEEVAYIVEDCEARVLIADSACAAAARLAAERSTRVERQLAVGGAIDGFEPYQAALDGEDSSDLADASLGASMLYTSGTTGRPKGVFREPNPEPTALLLRVRETAALRRGEDVALVTGPLYHAAPLGLNLAVPLGGGVGCILMDKWDAEETLALIDRHRVTHTHMVATMFHRLLALPDEVKSRYDTSSLRWVVHGAAPTSVHIKQQMIEWWGPVLYEYYAATEGGSFYVDSHEWSKKPGTVGRIAAGAEARVLDDQGNDLPAGSTGTIYFRAPEKGRFVYFKAPEKTAAAYRGDYFTMGDLGYFDQDGHLFLTGRSAETIIAGGVNIYPQEIDDLLVGHPAVYEVCTIGVPNEEWGESVRSVVELQPGYAPSPALAEELLEFCRQRLADFKRPRSIDFATDLPRLPTGKIQRHKVRAPYWAGRDRAI